MESDKENMNGVLPKSKIPLPVDPLPSMNKALLKWKKLAGTRHPLQTLKVQSNNEAGTSGKSDDPLKVDTRFVTVRDTKEDLDWNFNVFKDSSLTNNLALKNAEVSNQRKNGELNVFGGNQAKNCLGDYETGTPNVKCLIEPSRIRNIKKSLKRPHSRELQGISPPTNLEKGEEKHKRRLEFKEHLEKKQSLDPLKTTYMCGLTQVYIPDTFTYLLVSENRTPVPKIACNTRACVINWIMKINGPDGNIATVQTAQWYLDSVLSHADVDIHQLQLIAAASYWISQKLYGAANSAKKLVKCSSQAFTAGKLIRTERAIVKLLDFPKAPVIPQDFITYFCWSCDESNSETIEMAASFICMSSLIVDKSLCNECPSVIGAAAVYNALFLLRRKDAVMKLLQNLIFKMAEAKASCLLSTCSIQRKAIRRLSWPLYEYNTPFEHYNKPPLYIAQKVIDSANELAAKKKASQEK